MDFEEYILEIKKVMYNRYKDAKPNIARHNIVSVDVDHELYRDSYNDKLTPLEAIIEIELDNQYKINTN